jgi:hypothetical protein
MTMIKLDVGVVSLCRGPPLTILTSKQMPDGKRETNRKNLIGGTTIVLDLVDKCGVTGFFVSNLGTVGWCSTIPIFDNFYISCLAELLFPSCFFFFGFSVLLLVRCLNFMQRASVWMEVHLLVVSFCSIFVGFCPSSPVHLSQREVLRGPKIEQFEIFRDQSTTRLNLIRLCGGIGR